MIHTFMVETAQQLRYDRPSWLTYNNSSPSISSMSQFYWRGRGWRREHGSAASNSSHSRREREGYEVIGGGVKEIEQQPSSANCARRAREELALKVIERGGAGYRCSGVSSPSIANSGPWKQIQKFKAESVGSEDMDDPGMLLVDPQVWGVGL